MSVANGKGKTMKNNNLLTNHCVMDEKSLRRIYGRIFRKNLMLFYLGAGLMAAFGLLLVVLMGGLTPFSGFLLIAGAVYLFIGIRQPRKQAKRQIQSYEASGSGPNPEVTVWFDEEEFSAKREGMEEQTDIPYDDMSAIYDIGNRIILWTSGKQYIVLDTARFENGTEDDFWKLMRKKCAWAMPK